MTGLSDTQLVILSAIAQRDDSAVLPLPDSIKLKGGALNKVMDSLRNRGLIHVIRTDDDRPDRLVLTSEGMAAIGVEADDDGALAPADTAPTSAEPGSAADAPAPASDTHGAQKRAKSKAARGKAKAAKTAPATRKTKAKAATADKPTPRTGTKQALMIEMLKRPEGATVEQITAATGWQHHTIRGAISGALKKKLGLIVEARRSPVRRAHPGSRSQQGAALRAARRSTGSAGRARAPGRVPRAPRRRQPTEEEERPT